MQKHLIFLLFAIGVCLTSCVNYGYEYYVPKEFDEVVSFRPITLIKPSQELPDSSKYVGEVYFYMNQSGSFSFENFNYYMNYKTKDLGANAIHLIPEKTSFSLVLKGRMYLIPDAETFKYPFKKKDYEALETELKNTKDDIEGIYETSSSVIIPENDGYYSTFGIKKAPNGDYMIIFMKGDFTFYYDYNKDMWFAGDIFGYLSKTANPNKFILKSYNSNKIWREPILIKYVDGNFIINDQVVRKVHPKKNPISNVTSSLTAFYLGGNKVLTCAHGVNGAYKEYKIRGINGDFTKSYPVKVEKIDRVNDLALLSIENASIGSEAFQISSNDYNITDEVFVLGYPFSDFMGLEIKYSNGVINSKVGFNDDPREFQLSAPVQPGNSGSPVFNKNGEVIGMLSSGIRAAENVSYAIKQDVIKEFLKGVNFNSSDVNTKIRNLNVKEKADIAKKLIYLIEVCDITPPRYFNKYPSDIEE